MPRNRPSPQSGEPMAALVKVGSHRARQKLVRLLGYLPPGYFSWQRQGEWREVPHDKLTEALAIKGISRANRKPDLRRFFPSTSPSPDIDTAKARLHYPDGRVVHYGDQTLAYRVWLALPKGVRCAFRSAGETRPVYAHDYVDRM
jgi:hypothetical protein